jgi:hypothetical protein
MAVPFKMSDDVEVAPLVTLRRMFALLTLFSTLRFVLNGWVSSQLIDPIVLFPFDGFGWLPRPTIFGATLLYAGMIIGSIGMLFERGHQAAAFLFFLCFTYVEVLDKANYLNHYYFVSLMAFMLAFIPSRESRGTVPWYFLWTPRLMLCMVYFYAGLAKLNSDWMTQALPLAIWLPQHSELPIIGSLFEQRWVAFAFSWAGALFDLVSPVGLIVARFRRFFYPILVVFHVLTWILFPIGVFPWVMIACTTVFFSDAWHQRFLRVTGHVKNAFLQTQKQDIQPAPPIQIQPAKLWVPRSLSFGLAMGFLMLQSLIPLRSLAIPGSLFWHEDGYRFSWRVMLMEKAGWATFFIVDESGKEQEVNLDHWLSPNQQKAMSTQPDMIVDFAHMLGDRWEERLGEEVRVRSEIWVSLNGRRSQLFVNPYIDLRAVSSSTRREDYVIPMDSIVRPLELYNMRETLKESNEW